MILGNSFSHKDPVAGTAGCTFLKGGRKSRSGQIYDDNVIDKGKARKAVLGCQPIKVDVRGWHRNHSQQPEELVRARGGEMPDAECS